jgi:hypothetical protein
MDSIWDLFLKNRDLKEKGITFITTNGDVFLLFGTTGNKCSNCNVEN